PKLFRNTGTGNSGTGDKRRFEDATAAVGLGEVKTVCLAAALADLDQDGDLDLVLCQYATNAEEALAGLTGKTPPRGGGPRLFVNVGEALAGSKGKIGALALKFKELELPKDAIAPGVVGLVVSDFDRDRDLDLLLLADRGVSRVILNDRLLRFRGDN